MDWVWLLFKEYVQKYLRRLEIYEPDQDQLQGAFIQIMRESTVTVLVQEPWQSSVRFKGLAKYDSSEMMPLINNPEKYLLSNFGGGKFKLNFHQGLNFIATINFKPEGEPHWKKMPEIDY